MAMARIVMACIVVAYMAMARIAMACTVMAYMVVARIVMACIVMAYMYWAVHNEHVQEADKQDRLVDLVLYIGSTSASPTACLLRGYGCAGTQNDRLGEAVILSTDTPIPAL